MAIHQTGALVRRFAVNALGRDIICGDIHGHFSRLQAALDAVGFDPARDRLFSVGDLVDRGPESDHVLDWLARPWFHAVSGNHDDFAIRYPLGNMQPWEYTGNGGGWNVANPPHAQKEIAAALAALPVAIEIETPAGLVGVVHADCPCLSWNEFTTGLNDQALSRGARAALIDYAQWSRDRADKLMADPIEGVRAVVVGHTPVPFFTSLGNVLFIDTGGWFPEHRKSGHFTLLDAATLQPVNRTPPI